jgi:hypothetical protein
MQKKNTTAITNTRSATPPIVPPTIAPVEAFLACAVGEGMLILDPGAAVGEPLGKELDEVGFV